MRITEQPKRKPADGGGDFLGVTIRRIGSGNVLNYDENVTNANVLKTANKQPAKYTLLGF